MRKYPIFSILFFILSCLFIAVYYNVINKDYTGVMHWWAQLLLVGSLINMFVSLSVWDNYKRKNKEKANDGFWESKFGKIVFWTGMILFMIIFFPLTISIFILATQRCNMKKRFKCLTNKGYSCRKEKGKNIYYFTKDNAVIRIIQDSEYKISYDGGKNYIDIVESELGTMEEREKLKEVMTEYENAHPVDKQRGDTIDTAVAFAEFLEKYIS